ncbi:hypothetical protein ACPAVH_34400 [Enterobacteriaceae bacterium TYF_5]
MVTQISTHSHSYRGFVIVTLPGNATRPLTQYQITLRNGADESHSFGNENSLQEAIKFIDNLFKNKE